MDLSPYERDVLDFERSWWTVPGPKEARIRAQFHESPSSYYRALQALLDQPSALAYDPLTVKRLRRRRDERRRVRLEGRQADPHSR